MNADKILKEYLTIYPNETEKQAQLKSFIESEDKYNLFSISNFNGHITARGVVYCVETKSILLFNHPDTNVWFEPGGHSDAEDKSIYKTALREVKEETGLSNFKYLNISDLSNDIPFDIDIHICPKNHNKHIPEHYHYNFRYLFVIDYEEDIMIDSSEILEYKWFRTDTLKNNVRYSNMIEKINSITKTY